ncbi:hypothetical protein [Paenibacillus agricola]|uniref:Uncharacterized protein n=1 Tax=Paenibacillus agricola TaxID=2716264 RepID=A0ABX0J6U2_9BACL|nr:hypothetical protein [Paenibacillus agricola]NHN32152.1 hypothetical protein [Paenibacillus agricola]
MTDRYLINIEYSTRQGKYNKELAVICAKATRPNIGDFTQAFKEQGIEVELKDIQNMIFQPIDQDSTDVTSLKVISTYKDFNYSEKTQKTNRRF